MLLTLLVLSALAAGLVDAIAGGGGIITLPALLACGLEPHIALATNKGQSVFGSGSSLIAFARGGQVDKQRAVSSFVFACAGAFFGALLVLFLSPALLRPVVVIMLLVAAVSAFLKKPQVTSQAIGQAKLHPRSFAVGIAFVLGCYDGFFGPGTGTLLILAYAYVFGDSLVRASGNAKVANFASNLAAFSLFAFSGAIRWDYAIPMAIAQVIGALIGTKLAIRKGAKLIRMLAVAVSMALAARVVAQMLTR